MSSKTFVYFGIFAGSVVGGYLPSLFGFDVFSPVSIIAGFLGAFVGFYIAYKFSN